MLIRSCGIRKSKNITTMLLSLIFYNECKFYKIREKQPAAFCLLWIPWPSLRDLCASTAMKSREVERGFLLMVFISFIRKPLAKYLNQIISIACSDQLISSHEWSKLKTLGQRLVIQTVPPPRDHRFPFVSEPLVGSRTFSALCGLWKRFRFVVSLACFIEARNLST